MSKQPPRFGEPAPEANTSRDFSGVISAAETRVIELKREAAEAEARRDRARAEMAAETEAFAKRFDSLNTPDPVVTQARLVQAGDVWPALSAHVGRLEAECATHEGRKAFYRADGDGLPRVRAALTHLAGLTGRLEMLNRG